MENMKSMESMKIGFIGGGNIATAIMEGIVTSKVARKENILIFDVDKNKLNAFDEKGFTVHHCADCVAKNADYIFLTIKPQFYDDVLNVIKTNYGKVFITVAPGITMAHIKSILGDSTKVIRTMPNTPAFVGEGVTAVCKSENVTLEEYENAKKIINSFSQLFEMEEKLLDPIISVSGSSPAYAYMFIDAIARSGERQGIDYKTALIMVAKTVLGSAKLLLNSTQSADVLIDNVCSKGGTTIEAVTHLKENNFYSLIDDAMEKCTKRALELKK